MTQRTERVDELLRQEIGSILAREVKDPRIGFATVTKVETTPDLGHARVWVSVIGQPGERTETIAALERAMPFVRHELGTRLRLRRIPDLHVRLDETIERGTRILHLLEELEAGLTSGRRRSPTRRRSRRPFSGSVTRATSPTNRRPPPSLHRPPDAGGARRDEGDVGHAARRPGEPAREAER